MPGQSIRPPAAYNETGNAMRALLWSVVLVCAAGLGLELLRALRANDAPWWIDLLASLGGGLVLSYVVQRAFGRRAPAGGGGLSTGDRAADYRAIRNEPITPRTFSSWRGPDPQARQQ